MRLERTMTEFRSFFQVRLQLSLRPVVWVFARSYVVARNLLASPRERGWEWFSELMSGRDANSRRVPFSRLAPALSR